MYLILCMIAMKMRRVQKHLGLISVCATQVSVVVAQFAKVSDFLNFDSCNLFSEFQCKFPLLKNMNLLICF